MRHRVGDSVPQRISRSTKRPLRRLVRRQIHGGHRFPGSLRHHRRKPDADARRASARGRDHGRRSSKAGRKVPVLAGAGGYNTAEVIELAKELHHMGADGILSVTPYYNKPTQEGLYRSITRRSPTPCRCRSSCITFRDAPASTSSLPLSSASRKSTISCGVKEASGNISQMATVCHHLPETFHRAERRRCHHHPADRAGRTRSDLGGLERNSGGDDQADAACAGGRLRRSPRASAPMVRR